MLSCSGVTFAALISASNPKKKIKQQNLITEMHAHNSFNFEFLTKKTYDPPSWATHLNPIPSHTYSLGHVIHTHSLTQSIYVCVGVCVCMCFCVIVLVINEKGVCRLFQFPTPIHRWNLPNLPNNTEVYLKVSNNINILF